MQSMKTSLMTEGSIFKNILFFSVPLILGNLLQQMYNAVDSIIVGNFVGKNALAAVGSSTSLIYLLIAFSQSAAVGAGVIVSQYQVRLREIKIQKRVALRIIQIGLPTGIQNMVISLSNMLVQSSTSFSMAVTTFTGQKYGAENLTV